MGVGVGRRGVICMAENGLQNLHADAKRHAEGRHRVPEAVQIDRPDARCGDVKLKLLVEPVRRDRQTVGADDVHRPGAGQDRGRLLKEQLTFEHRIKTSRNRNVPTARNGLRRSVDHADAGDPLPLIPNPDHAGGLIDIRPSKAGELAAAKAAAERELPSQGKRSILSENREAVKLFGRPPARIGATMARRIHGITGIRLDDAFAHCLLKRCAKDHKAQLGCARLAGSNQICEDRRDVLRLQTLQLTAAYRGGDVEPELITITFDRARRERRRAQIDPTGDPLPDGLCHENHLRDYHITEEYR